MGRVAWTRSGPLGRVRLAVFPQDPLIGLIVTDQNGRRTFWDEPWRLSAIELMDACRGGHLSPIEMVLATLEQIDRLDPAVNAFCELASDAALASARESKRRYVRARSPRQLEGVPVAVKDLLLTNGVRTRRGSPLFADDIPREDAPVVARLEEAGA
jgi:aspartyl-tRNA(Asn)/glutamyl-tRNA(Gln) amidotransferase subunit A